MGVYRMDLRKLTLLLISGLTIMAAAAVAPSLTEIAEEFSDVQNADLLSKLVLSLPAIFIAGTAPFAGRLTDQYGRLRLLVLGLILYGLGGSSGFYLDNLYLILAGRAILGLAVGILTTVTITLIGDYFSGEERKTFIGYQSTYIASVGIVFLVGAGVLADLDWRYPFLIYCLAIVLIPLAIRHLEEPKRERVELISGVHLSKPLLILFANS